MEKKRKGGNEDALVTEGEVQVMEDHPQALSQEEGLGAENQPPSLGRVPQAGRGQISRESKSTE